MKQIQRTRVLRAALFLGGVVGSASALAIAPLPAPVDTTNKVGYENFEAPGVFATTVQSNGNITEYLGRGAGEPSIGVNWKSTTDTVNGVTNFQSDLQTLFVRFNDSCPSSAPKAIWINHPAPTSVAVDSDPIGFTNLVSGRVFAGELTLLSPTCKISYTDDDGATWVPTTGPLGSAVDHQTIGGGPYHELAPGVAPPYSSALTQNQAFYYCSQDLATAYCMRSDDAGNSWTAQTPWSTSCNSQLHGHVKVGPEGTVYIPNKECANGNAGLGISTTNGTTWTVSNVTDGTYTVGVSDSDAAVGIDKSGRVYFAQASGDASLSVAVSENGGTTWKNIYNVSDALGVKGVRYPAAVGGDPGRAAIAFLGTTTSGNFNGSTFWGVWHMYIAHTFDGGTTWTVTDATPDLPVQRGCIWTGGGGDICRNLLDFFDIAIDKQGRVQVGYVNGCPGGSCPQAPAGAKGNGYSATATIARQSSGRRMLAALDATTPTTSVPGIPTVVARRVGTTVHLGWSEGDTGNLPITEFQIWRGTQSGAETLLTTVAGNVSRYDDTTATDYTKTYYYKVVAVNALGPSCGDNELGNEIAVPYVGDTCPGMVIHQNESTHPESAPVQNGANANLAIDFISIAEPVADLLDGASAVVAPGGTYFKFTMKVDDLTTVPPNSRWRMVWDSWDAGLVTTGKQLFYLGMRTDGAGAATFEYGTVGDAGVPAVLILGETKKGAALSPSNFNSDGTITIYVPKSAFRSPGPGDLLGAFGGKTFTGDSGPTGTGTYQRSTALVDHTFIKGVTDNSYPAATYMLRDAAHVTDNHVPVGLTFTADKTYGNPPLAVNFGASQSDEDGDAPGSYKYDFGDGTAPLTKSCGNAPYLTPACATASHSYANPGYYTATMWPIDSCGLQGAPLTLLIHVNAPPVANAGADFNVNEIQTAMLSGALTTDADHDPADVLSYSWAQTGGPTVSLVNPTSVTPSFVAPMVAADTTLTFDLTVTDSPGGLSSTDSVTVTVKNVNLAPTADAGDDFGVDEGGTALLSGSGSLDIDGDAISYAWRQTGGSTVTLNDADTATPSFTAPLVPGDTPFTFELKVTDIPGGLSAIDEITVTVVNLNRLPVARAGLDLIVDEGTPGALNGTESSDADGETLSYSWTQIEGPATTLTNANSATPTFKAPGVPENTLLKFRLTVTDPYDGASIDDVAVTVRDLGNNAVAIGNNAAGGLPLASLILLGLSGLLRRRRRLH
jgi:hypothetical protein